MILIFFNWKLVMNKF